MIGALLVAYAVAGMSLVAGHASPSAPGVAQFAVADSDLPSGDTITFECPHGTIALNGTSVCHDQSTSSQNLGTGYHSYTMLASADSGHAFNEWNRTGDACLGVDPACWSNSTYNPASLWESCSTTCSGVVVLSSPAIKSQALTARIFEGWGTVKIGGTLLSNGQSIAEQGGSVVAVSGSPSKSSYPFWRWVSDDGQFANLLSNATNLTVRNAPSGVGNVSLLLNNTTWGYWDGLVASGSGFSEVSGTFSIPSTAEECSGSTCENTTSIWVGIGGVNGNLWQAGVCLYSCYNSSPWRGSAGRAYAFYQEYPQWNGARYNTVALTNGSTLTVSVTFYPGNGTSTFKIVCDTGGGTGCGWSTSTWSGSPVTYTPDRTTAEWIAEYVTDYGNVTFWAPSFAGSGGSGTSFSASSAVFGALLSCGGNTCPKYHGFVTSVTAATLSLKSA